MRSTSATGERAVGGRLSGLLDLDDEVTWRARHFGVCQRLTTRITAYDRRRYFEDTMLRGAFARMRHDHFFEEADGGTLVRDVVEFAAPLPILGRLAETLFLTSYMRRFLLTRNEELKQLAESDGWRAFVQERHDE